MYSQSQKAYAKVNALINSDKPKEKGSFKGLLGRMSPIKEKEKEQTPQQMVVDMVKDLRKARAGLKNG